MCECLSGNDRTLGLFAALLCLVSGKKSKEEQEKAAVEQEALTKITTALEAGTVQRTHPHATCRWGYQQLAANPLQQLNLLFTVVSQADHTPPLA